MATEYFTLAELRALPDLSNTSTYTDAELDAAAAHIVAIIEREVGTSFIARTVSAELHNGGDNRIVPRRNYVRSITSATEGGVTVTDTLTILNGVLLRLSGGSLVTWATGYANVSITYVYGYTATVPADIKEIALRASRLYLLATGDNSAANARRTSLSGDMGVETWAIAGKDRPTGYPEIDAVILGYKSRLDYGGFA